ncbi:MAG: tRNA (adenosine(37)-N6)-threonylcarbamoyltransferase complex ATPase subunit type 1 TsaE [Terriglobia bacterium]
MPSRTFQTHSEDETIALGRELAPELTGAVLLIGNLGAGKTTMTKGIVEGLGAATPDVVSSPTFTLIHQYSPNVFHVDLYRLDEPREVETLGLDDLFSSGAVVILEWAERFPALMPAARTEIRITTRPDDSREIVVSTLS